MALIKRIQNDNRAAFISKQPLYTEHQPLLGGPMEKKLWATRVCQRKMGQLDRDEQPCCIEPVSTRQGAFSQ